MRVIAVYPGRFHPFHQGHADSFKQLASAFGLKNTYLAISQKQEPPRSPFSAIDRAKMAMSLGIPKENIITVKNAYGGKEYMERFQGMGVDINDTALVFGVSQKDMGTDPRFTFTDKKDGTPSYMQPISKGVESPMTTHAFIMTTQVKPFTIAEMAMTDASQIRSAYAKGDSSLKERILSDLYGVNARHIRPIFEQNLSIMESIYKKLVILKQRITESKQNVMENRFVVTHHNSLSDETLTILVKADDEYDAKDKVSYSLGRGSNIVDVRPARGDEPTDQEYKAYKDPRTGLSRAGIYDIEQGVAEGYWQDALKKAEADREARKGKPFKKNPASHDKQGVYKGDKDLAGNPVPKRKEQGVAEGRENYNGLNLLLQQDDDELFVKASAGNRELGHVLFVIDDEYLMPQDLEVDERYQGQGIAQTMYDFVKSKGYKIRRSGQQTDAGAGFWNKHRGQGVNVWEQEITEDSAVYTVIANGEELPCHDESHAENKARKLLSYGKADIVYVAKNGHKIYSWKMGEPKQPMTEVQDYLDE